MGSSVPSRAAGPFATILLVLSADVSRSVDHPKFLLQREGYAAAISDPQVIEAVKSGPHRSIALCYIEWSGFAAQKVLIDWSLVDGPDAARKFGNQLLELPRSFADRTSISGGIEFATAQLERSPYVAPRRTIGISGDGINQDSLISFLGVQNGPATLGNAPTSIRADQLSAGGVRLRYINCPPSPFLNSTVQNAC